MHSQFDTGEIPSSNIATISIQTNSPAQSNLFICACERITGNVSEWYVGDLSIDTVEAQCILVCCYISVELLGLPQTHSMHLQTTIPSHPLSIKMYISPENIANVLHAEFEQFTEHNGKG